MFGVNNTMKVMIGKDIDRTATVQITDPSAATYIADGEILILDALDAPASAASEYVKFVQRSGDNLHFSPRIKVANILHAETTKYAAATEQVDYIGYNTSTGSITEIDYNNYFLHVTYLHDKELWSEQQNKRIYHYMSGDNATQKDIANSFVAQINKDQFSLGGYGAVKAEMLVDSTTVSGVGGTSTVTNGSTYVTITAGSMAVGDVVRLGTNAVATPVYIVKTVISATVYELTSPYQGASATTVTSNIVSAITAYGIKLTGLPLTYVAKGLKPYKKVFYNIATVGFTSTLTTASTRMTYGQGVWQQVSDLEWFALGGDGIRNYMWHPIPEGRTDVVSGTSYNTITMEFTNTDEAYVISGTKPAKALVYLFIPGNTSGTNQVADIISEINTATGLSLAW